VVSAKDGYKEIFTGYFNMYVNTGSLLIRLASSPNAAESDRIATLR